MTALLAALFLAGAFVFAGLDAAWQALDRVRLRQRADKGNKRARQIMAWEAARPQADLALAWTAHALAAASLVTLAAGVSTQSGAKLWSLAVPLVFLPVYAVFMQMLPRQIFRRMPFFVLARLWWLVDLAGSFWAPLARPVSRLMRRVKKDPLPRRPAADDLLAMASKIDDISQLEQSMLGSVLGFRRLTAGRIALQVSDLPHVPADLPLGEIVADRRLVDARHVLVMDAAGLPLGVMSCGTAALSGALSARAQSFARPLLSFPADMPAWKVLANLRRSATPVAEVKDDETGSTLGVVTVESAVARLLGQAV